MKFASLLPRFRVSDLTPYCWSEFWGALHRGNTANVYLAFDCVFERSSHSMNPVESTRSPGGQARRAFLPVTGTCPSTALTRLRTGLGTYPPKNTTDNCSAGLT